MLGPVAFLRARKPRRLGSRAGQEDDQGSTRPRRDLEL